MATTLTSKGQVTIPKPVRDLLGLTTGSRVNFEMEPGGRVVLVAEGQPTANRRFAKLRGRAGAGLSTEAIMALTRGEM